MTSHCVHPKSSCELNQCSLAVIAVALFLMYVELLYFYTLNKANSFGKHTALRSYVDSSDTVIEGSISQKQYFIILQASLHQKKSLWLSH